MLIVWIVIYFIIGYQKQYGKQRGNEHKMGIRLTLIGLVGYYGLIVLTNFVELRTGIVKDGLLMWNESYNPFLITLAVGLFYLASGKYFTNRAVNYISGLTLYIYIIHENLLFRLLYRPAMWNYVYMNYGYEHVLRWVVLFVVLIFIASMVLSMLYMAFVHKIVVSICNRILYPIVASSWRKIEAKCL